MPMSPGVRQQQLESTRSSAIAFLEDMTYFRGLLSQPDIDAAAIRRASNELRRLLIDNGGDLEKIAPPRIGRIHLSSLDNLVYYRADKTKHFRFFGSGGANLFGIEVRAMLVMKRGRINMDGFNPEGRSQVSTDQFLAQRVLCLDNAWATRRDAIKYVANVAHGVHSGTPNDPVEKTLRRIRAAASYNRPAPNSPYIGLNLQTIFSETERPLKYDPRALDPVLVELLAAIRLIVESPKIAELETTIKAEIG